MNAQPTKTIKYCTTRRPRRLRAWLFDGETGGATFTRTSCENSAFLIAGTPVSNRLIRKSTEKMRHTAIPSVSIVLTTLGEDDDARAIATVLVQEGLAACVNIIPA